MKNLRKALSFPQVLRYNGNEAGVPAGRSDMTAEEAVLKRHSVRAYEDREIPDEIVRALEEEVAAVNAEGKLAVRLVRKEPRAFRSFLARYGKFSGVKNYFAMAGLPEKGLSERVGYFGERLVLRAQELGLNTCWAALSFGKGSAKEAARLAKGEKLVCVIALGYGKTQGVSHKSKRFAAVAKADDPPVWFRKGVDCALLAPTAVNQQKFFFTLTGENKVRAEQKGGFYGEIDLGIVKYHFEIGAGKENFVWEE